MSHTDTTLQAKHVVIAKPDRPYAEALEAICTHLFPTAKTHLCGSGDETLNALEDHPTDLLLLSLNFPDADGAELLLTINKKQLAKHMLVFVEQHYESIISALRTTRVNAVVDTYTETLESVRAVLNTINRGEVYISPALRSCLIDNQFSRPEGPTLTSAEIRVLQIIGTGCDNQEAAPLLGLTEATVQTHRRNIMRKLGVPTSAKLVREAVRLGFVRITSAGIVSPISIPESVEELSS